MSETHSLALQFRPQTWSELMGQPIPRTFFVNSLTPSDQYPHGKFFPAYLLHGTTGCGKTSSAILLAKRALCENPQGPNPCNECTVCRGINRGSPNPNLEIVDGTTDRGLEFVNSHIAPWLSTQPMGSSRLKVMIIDEFHRYTSDAKSAFLILLEELKQRNPRAIVVLCTTEAEKLEPALKNRCIPLHYAPLPASNVSGYVVQKLAERGQEVDPRLIELMVKACGGSMRHIWQHLDLWTVLNQPLTEELVFQLVHGISQERRAVFWQALTECRIHDARKLWEEWQSQAAEPQMLGRQLLEDLVEARSQEPLRVEWIDALRILSMAQLLNSDDAWLPALLSLQLPLAPTEVLKQAMPSTYIATMPAPAEVRAAQVPSVPTPEPTVAAPQFDPDGPDYDPQAAQAAYGGPEVHHVPESDSEHCTRCGKFNYPGHLCKPADEFEQATAVPNPANFPHVQAALVPSLNDPAEVLTYLLGR